MKKLLLALLFITATSVTNAQQTVVNQKDKQVVTHISGNNYDVIYTNLNGDVVQEGQYYKIGERFKPHGIWKLYNRNSLSLVTTAKYDKGEQIWVETIVDGETIRVNKYELKVKRLEERIVALEEKVNGL